MSNFNEFLKNRGLKIIVESYFDGADDWNDKAKITNRTYKIKDEQQFPASYYIENGLTAAHTIIISYDINNNGEFLETTFDIPKEIDGTFIIEGTYRISTNKLGNDYDCRMRFSGTSEHTIHFDYNRQYSLQKKILRVKRINPELGISEKDLDIPYELIDETLEDPVRKEALKLTEKQSKKFQIKLDIDYYPEYITRQLIDDCIAFGDDRDKDLIIDKSVDTVAQGFLQFLLQDNNRKNLYSPRKKIKDYFYKNSRLQENQNSLTNLFNKYWKGTQDASSKEIVVPPGVNAVNLESLSSKITIPKTVAYNTSMKDIIDIADTPINQILVADLIRKIALIAGIYLKKSAVF